MTKIMLVEDDKSLREIYGVRLLAEGYDIVSAGDGEEALAVAIKERPQLIISDVMIPKVSGYDMLDILRSTTETKNIRVIMMTALSSDEQRTRAESLGADRYLVKSQVGIEDVVRVVHEVLEDRPGAAPTAPQPSAPSPAPAAPTQPQPLQPLQSPQPAAAPQAPPAPAPQAPPQPPRPTTTTVPKPPSLQSRVIQPLNDPANAPVDINQLLDKELAKEAGITEDALPPISTATQEKDMLAEQLQSFQAASDPAPVETSAIPAVPSNLGLTGTEGEEIMPSPGLTPLPPTPSTPPSPAMPPAPGQVPPAATVPPTPPLPPTPQA